MGMVTDSIIPVSLQIAKCFKEVAIVYNPVTLLLRFLG